MAQIRHTPPGASYPVALIRLDMTFLKYVGCDAIAARVAPATTMLKTGGIALFLDYRTRKKK
jgi:hypothetical protein